MLQDYLRSFWRGVLHNKAATFINVSGLALGLAVFFGLSFYVYREFSWDDHWQDADRMYRVMGTQEAPTGNVNVPFSNAPWVLGTSLQSRNPDAFAAYTRVLGSQSSLVIDGEQHPFLSISYAEPSLLDLLQLETVEGSLQDVFADPRSVAVNVDVLERLFGTESPLGRTITVNTTQGIKADHVVRAVFRLPKPTSFTMPLLALLDTTAPPVPNAGLDVWNFAAPPQPSPLNASHYFKLQPGVDPDLIASDLRAFMDEAKYMEFGNTKTRFGFQPIQDVHLSPNIFVPGDNVRRLWSYAAIGVLVLLISACNFVMLATLRSLDRMREVGIRKTLGGEAGQLMCQYLLDAFIQALVAAGLALVLLELALPALQESVAQSLAFDPDWRSVLLCLGIAGGFTLVSGAYPALVMSRGKPGPLLRSSSGAVVASGNALRTLPVCIQFAIVIVLLLASAVVKQQIQFVQNRDRGFDLEGVTAMRLNSAELMNKVPALVTEFTRVPGVQAAAVGSVSPGSIMITTPTLFKRVSSDGSTGEAGLEQSGVGAGYFGIMSVPLRAGREFTEEVEGAAAAAAAAAAEAAAATPAVQGEAREQSLILNEAAARALGYASPELALDSLLEYDTRTPNGQTRKLSGRVTGVVADTQFSSVLLPPVPQAYFYSARSGFLAIKLEPGAELAAVTAALKDAWHAVMGGVLFALLPADQLNFNMLQREEFESRIVIGSSVLALVIALLGLYGLVAATVVKRVKEIGVRKVMGADSMTIVTLLLWQFSKPVVVANLLAWPLGFWGVMQWLQRFPYRLDLVQIVMSGLAASLLALLIAWLTVGLMTARAASAKPVLALRYE